MSRTILGEGDLNAKDRGHLFTAAVTDTTPVTAIFQTAGADRFCVQFIWTGTVAGTLKVEVSNNHRQSTDGGETAPVRAGDWTDISSTLTLPTVTTPGGGTSTGMIQLGYTDEAYVRVTFTPTSGAGNADAWLNDRAYA